VQCGGAVQWCNAVVRWDYGFCVREGGKGNLGFKKEKTK